MTYLLLTTAISLSAIAAYYSIVGLMAIFAAAAIPIAVMGSVLEVSKLVVASWLYRNWRQTPILLKSYFIVAVTVLMLLTSMGIFGFLSKAHSDQSVVSDEVTSKLALIEEKIKIQKENIDAARKTLSQLDSQVDSALSRTTDADGVSRSTSIRRTQQAERAKLLSEIEKAQREVGRLNEEKAPIASEVRKVEAEVGPLKYIAALVYGDNPDANVLEKSVRMLILMIVFVFDPLAVLMFMAVNQSLKKDESVMSTIRQEPSVASKIGEEDNTQNLPTPESIPETEIVDLINPEQALAISSNVTPADIIKIQKN